MSILSNINFQKISKGHAKSNTLGGESKTATNAEITRWLLSSSKSCSWYGCPFQAVCYHFRDQFFHPVPLSIANNLLLMLLSLVFGNRWPRCRHQQNHLALDGFRISVLIPESNVLGSEFSIPSYNCSSLCTLIFLGFVSWKNEEFEPISERRFSVWQIREYSGCFVRTRPIITAISLTLTLWLEQTGKTRKRGSKTGNYAHKPKCARG